MAPTNDFKSHRRRPFHSRRQRHEEAQHRVDSETLQELNGQLSRLAELFPEIRLDLLREHLSSFPGPSRLNVATNMLLSNRALWLPDPQVRTRLTPTGKDVERLPQGVPFPKHELFRSESYIDSVTTALYEEFSGSLSNEFIGNVLSSNNWYYADSRTVLLEASGKTWRQWVKRVFNRRVDLVPTLHPLILGNLTDADATRLRIKPGLDEALSAELHEALIAPLQEGRVKQQMHDDEHLARQINDEEAQAVQSTYDCDCCLCTNTFEQITVCSEDQHFICHECLARTMSEAVYGQGWAQGVRGDKGTLNCVALSTGPNASCPGWIPREQLQMAMNSNHENADMWSHFEKKVQDTQLNPAEHLLQCPFCPYAESTDISPKNRQKTGASWINISFCALIGLGMPLFCMGLACVYPNVCYTGFVLLSLAWLLNKQQLRNERESKQKPKQKGDEDVLNGRKFVCRSPSCSRKSCLKCLVDWTDPHRCFSASSNSLRNYVEAAITRAIKRTCPACGVSFVKSSGCNHFRCGCGFVMCYLCRADISHDQYQHFCQHFRPAGGECAECTRCLLYKEEDENAVREAAAQQANEEWWEQERERTKTTRGEDTERVLERMRSTLENDGDTEQRILR